MKSASKDHLLERKHKERKLINIKAFYTSLIGKLMEVFLIHEIIEIDTHGFANF